MGTVGDWRERRRSRTLRRALLRTADVAPGQGVCGYAGCVRWTQVLGSEDVPSVKHQAAPKSHLIRVGTQAAERLVSPHPASEAVEFGQLQAIFCHITLQGEAPRGEPKGHAVKTR